MNQQELRDKIMAAINGIIKDEPETAEANLHDVLAAKMRARMNGETGSEDGDAVTAPSTEPTGETTPATSAPTATESAPSTEEQPGT